MQHWVLVAVLEAIEKQIQDGELLLVCSHSMAPRSRLGETKDPTRAEFDRVRRNLGRPFASRYECAWLALSGPDGLPYPSSAALALELWTRPLSMVLCETDSNVATEIEKWFGETAGRMLTTQLFRDDWRRRFEAGISPERRPQVVFAEMDPMRFESHDEEQCPRTDRAVVFPEDLDLIGDTFKTDVPVVLQISSYSANNNNPHEVTEPIITASMERFGFRRAAMVAPCGQFISLVYTRGLELDAGMADLGLKFKSWLALFRA